MTIDAVVWGGSDVWPSQYGPGNYRMVQLVELTWNRAPRLITVSLKTPLADKTEFFAHGTPLRLHHFMVQREPGSKSHLNGVAKESAIEILHSKQTQAS